MTQEQAKAQSKKVAEDIYDLLEQLSILPPEFIENTLMQAALISGMTAKIESVLTEKD